ALAAHLVGDVGHGQGAVHRLAAGHGDGVVVEDLVGDVDAGGDRLADGQRAGMEIGDVTEVLEDVLLLGEGRLARPGDAFAAHVGEGVGAAVHPGDHVVAADAAERARPLRHHRRGVVRAARAVVRHAREVGARQRQLLLLGGDPLQAVLHRLGAEEALLASGHDLVAAGWNQHDDAGYEPVDFFVVHEDDPGALDVLADVLVLLHLTLDAAALLLAVDDVLQATGEFADAERLQRSGHADLV